MRLRGGGTTSGNAVKLRMDLINVQGLTDTKAIELRRRMNEGKKENEVRIGCLVETHEKYRRFEWGNQMLEINQMRDINDKKGGGLMIITNDLERVSISKQSVESVSYTHLTLPTKRIV